MVLENQQIQSQQEAKNYQAANMPARSFRTWHLAAPLPITTNEGRWGSRICVDQIARSDSAGQVSAFWQITALVSRGKNAAVPAGGRSTPSRVASLVGHKSERPFGIDALYGTDADAMSAQYVFDDHYLLIGADFGQPETDYREVAKQQRGRQAQQSSHRSLVDTGDDQRQQQDADDRAGEQPGEFGSENLHDSTLTRLREVCLG